jgi:hypothetical protein
MIGIRIEWRHREVNMRILLASITFGVCGFAQQASITSIVGRITDPNGAAITNASVKAVEDGTQQTYSGATNVEGLYSFQFVRSGTYTITAAAPGFATLVRKGVLVQVNQVVRGDFQLTVGQLTERITVSAEPPPIATDEASIAEVLDRKTLADIPLNGRDLLRAAALTPGVLPGMKSRTGATTAGGQDFIGAGAREVQNSISLDGVSIVSNLISTTTLRPSVDAVSEFQIQTGTYSAQYGTWLGVHLNVISKTGTNEFHGAAWEFLRNQVLDARNFFAAPTAPKPPFRQNQFGGQLDGPLIIPKLYNGRNKTFFLVSYEGQRQAQSQSSLAAVLPAAFRSGNLSAISTPIRNPLSPGEVFPNNVIPSSLLSPQAQRALAYMPLPTLPGLSNNYQAQTGFGNTTDQTLDRVDQNLGDKVRLFFRLAYQNTSLLQGSSNPFNGFNVPLYDRNYATGYTHTISPRAVNDFRFGYEKNQYQSQNFFTNSNPDAGTELGIPGFTTGPNNPGLPNLSITGYVAIGGQNMDSSNWRRPSSTFQFTDVLNYTVGSHSIATGAEFFRLSQGDLGNNGQRGVFSFTGDISGNAAADFLVGFPRDVTTPAPASLLVSVRQWRNAFFVSDKWSVSPKLTLTLGLRYELPTVAQSHNGTVNVLNTTGTALIPANDPPSIPLPTVPLNDPQHNAFAPRFGFAYRATKDWVIRGGYGLYYNANQLNLYTIGGNPPFSNVATYTSEPARPSLTLNNPTAGTPLGASPTPNIVTFGPYLPMATMNQWSLDVAHPLWSGAGLDVQYLGSRTIHLDRSYHNNTPLPGPGPIQARRPNQRWGVIRTIANDMVSNYNSLNVVLRQRYSHGLSMLFSYTWSHALDVSTDSNGGGSVIDPYNWKGSYGNSNWDIRHRLVASYFYELPFFKTSTLWRRSILGGWQINGVTTIQSGTPINVTASGDPPNTGRPGGMRPDLIAPAVANCGSGRLVGCISAASFALATPFNYGNAGRNILTGPGLVQTDLSLFKNLPLGTERVRLQLRGEAFNVFNTPSFSNPASNFGTATFGSIGSTLIPNRQVQVAAKIIF